MEEKVELVIITGMSGAGKTVAIQSFEDMGYFCIDNMPPKLIPKFWELIRESGKINKIALVVDLRSRSFFEEVQSMLIDIEHIDFIHTRILFLDASDSELVSRYKETRRSHPMALEGLVTEGIQKERNILAELKARASIIIDTTTLTPRKLREKINEEFSNLLDGEFRVQLLSFGFKYGLPIDADIVMDVRFLPNPYYLPELRSLTGIDKEVSEYVMSFEESKSFFEKFSSLLLELLPQYIKEGKKSLTVGLGCTGGQHRSVALTEEVAKFLASDYQVKVTHRDKDRRKETVNRS